MTHEDAGHYRAKHPQGTTPDPALAAALAQRAEDGLITCKAAHDVAAALGAAPSAVGTTADLLEYRIVECQLGLFGYSPEKRIVKPAAEVSPALREQLERHATEGTIDCASCWRIAETLGLQKMAVSAACERLGLKIKPCQLGAF
jgi:hypothetical protein